MQILPQWKKCMKKYYHNAKNENNQKTLQNIKYIKKSKDMGRRSRSEEARRYLICLITWYHWKPYNTYPDPFPLLL